MTQGFGMEDERFPLQSFSNILRFTRLFSEIIVITSYPMLWRTVRTFCVISKRASAVSLQTGIDAPTSLFDERREVIMKTCRVVARSGELTDGPRNILPLYVMHGFT